MNAAWLFAAFLPLTSAEGTMPPPPPATLLFVRVVGPDGTKVIVRPGSAETRTFDQPAVAGFRPGYYYRVGLGNVGGDPMRTLYPSFEVISTLHVPPSLKAEDYPATIRFTEDDIKRAAAGGLVTKVVYLEDPFQAPALTSTPEHPIEFDVTPGKNPLEEARYRGRPVLIVRLGERDIAPQELAAAYIPGTVLALGDGPLGQPACPPTLPLPSFQWFDPILGPKKPLEEILPDGGDVGPRIGIGPDGRTGNLNVTDTAAEFRYGNGPRRVTISNRVCLFSPRFAVLRAEHSPAANDLVIPIIRVASATPSQQVVNKLVTDDRWNAIAVRGFDSRLGLRGTQSRIEPGSVDRVQGVAAYASVEGVALKAGVIEPVAATQINGCYKGEPLTLTKYADPKAPNVGDVVTFILKYENLGTKPMRDVVVMDSLASRFEYVPGSAQTDRPVVFTLQMNESYSALLRWEVKGDLMPGQSGMVKFQAKVR
ncbi:MAG: hypothetical protein U0746_14780 [Gemmataceae bacterium]